MKTLKKKKFLQNLFYDLMILFLSLSKFQQKSYENDSDKGLPIGNLSSQYFANHYMAYADHSAKETIKVQALVRYMDDVLMFGNDKNALIKQVRTYECFLNDELGLTLHEPIYNRTEFGIPFLGYVVYPYKRRLNQNSRRRLRRRFYKMCEPVFNGDICDDIALCRLNRCLHLLIRLIQFF